VRRCPRCFSVYDDRTARCAPCDEATETFTGREEGPSPATPARSGGPGRDDWPRRGVGEPAPGAGDETGEVVLAEADPDWAERAVEALARAGIAAQPLLSEDDPPLVAIVVAAADQGRAVDVLGEALDEPPALSRETAPPLADEAPETEAGPGPPEEAWEDAPAAGPPADLPPRPLDPDQAARCPECGEAYRAGFERCADCDVPLIPAEGDPPA
jgi:hypothetical protein